MIELLQSLKIAMRALRINKMRSFLTMLGIIIGIAAVIAMVAIGSGASKMISEQIASIGSNLLLVLPGSTPAAVFASVPAVLRPLPMTMPGQSRRNVRLVSEVAPTVRGRPRWSSAT